MKITIVAGTNRQGSNTLRVATALVPRYEAQGAEVTLLDLRDLPSELLHPGAYANKPDAYEPFKQAVLDADGLVVVTPEYNGSFPGVLKLFIDMLPFPEAFEKRPVAFVGVASGRWGALRPVEQLQGVFGYRNAFIFPERIFLPGVGDELDEDAQPTTPLVAQLLTQQIEGFVAFCKAVKPLRPS